MKLWQVIQWGNKEEGPNGLDTQCIVSAANMEAAIAKGEFHFNQYAFWKQADVIYLLGYDDRPDGDALLIVPIWLHYADNLQHNPAWFRKYWDDGTWATEDEVYPDYKLDNIKEDEDNGKAIVK